MSRRGGGVPTLLRQIAASLRRERQSGQRPPYVPKFCRTRRCTAKFGHDGPHTVRSAIEGPISPRATQYRLARENFADTTPRVKPKKPRKRVGNAQGTMTMRLRDTAKRSGRAGTSWMARQHMADIRAHSNRRPGSPTGGKAKRALMANGVALDTPFRAWTEEVAS